jgi:hypothetical protein
MAQSDSEAFCFDPNGPGMGLDVDFNNFDLGNIDAINLNIDSDVANFGINNDINFNDFNLGGFDINNAVDYSANLGFEDTPNDVQILLGPHETSQEANTSALIHFPPLKPANEKSDALTLAEASNPNSNPEDSTHQQEPVNKNSNEMRAQKRKKTDEVDKGHILPEGSRRNRNKTARARGLDSLA